MAFLEGKRGREMFDEWRSKVLPTFVLGCCFWIPAQAANFRFDLSAILCSAFLDHFY
jgi:Mpv17 / PMP22 family